MTVRTMMRIVALSGVLMLASCGTQSNPELYTSETTPSAELSTSGIKGVRFIGLSVSDIDETLAFYQSAVPYRLVRRDKVSAASLYPDELIDADMGEVEVALVDARNVFVQLVDFDPDTSSEPVVRPVKGPGYTHICYISPAADSAFPKLRAAGLSMVTRGNEPVDLGGYGMRYAYGLDPNGAMIETEVADEPRRDGGPWVGHIGSATPDADRMSDFYTALLGYGPRRRAEYANRPLIDHVVNYDNTKLRSSWFVSRNLEIEFWEYINPRTPERDAPARVDTLGYTMIAYEVDDLEAERARLSDLAEWSAPHMTPFGWRISTAYDPDGNILALHQRVSADVAESIDTMLWIDPETF